MRSRIFFRQGKVVRVAVAVAGFEFAHDAVQHLEEQMLLCAEVPQDAALGGAGLLGDLIEGHAPEAGLGEELPGDLQNVVPGPLPPFRAGNLRSCHNALPEMMYGGVRDRIN